MSLPLATPPPDARPPAPLSFRVLIPWAIVAGLAVGGAWLGQLYFAARAEIALLHDQEALSNLAVIGARQQAEAERILSNRQLAEDKRHLVQLDQQIAQSTHQIADARREIVEISARLVTSRIELHQLRERLASVTDDASTLRERLKTETDLAQFQLVALASPAAGSSSPNALVVWNPIAQAGLLRIEKLPAAASDRDYQLWIGDPAYPEPVDAGVFTVDAATGAARITFKPRQPVTNPTQFSVRLERKGGAPKAAGPVLLVGE